MNSSNFACIAEPENGCYHFYTYHLRTPGVSSTVSIQLCPPTLESHLPNIYLPVDFQSFLMACATTVKLPFGLIWKRPSKMACPSTLAQTKWFWSRGSMESSTRNISLMHQICRTKGTRRWSIRVGIFVRVVCVKKMPGHPDRTRSSHGVVHTVPLLHHAASQPPMVCQWLPFIAMIFNVHNIQLNPVAMPEPPYFMPSGLVAPFAGLEESHFRRWGCYQASSRP